MPFPNAEDKHAGRQYVTPHRLLRYRAEQGRPVDSPPRTVIVGWQGALLERVKSRRLAREIAGPAGAVLELSPTVGFARLPIGAPVVAIVLEELGALGVETIVGIGTAGALADTLHPGNVVVCSAALRDEGTSHHYAPASTWATPDTGLLSCLQAALPDAAVGPTWTTDAPYRETAEEIQRYRGEGILTVDMEAAALFTVAATLGLRAASIFCVSDTLHGSEWEPHFHAADIGARLWSLFEVVESVLTTAL
jgi:uridine phosphorylase